MSLQNILLTIIFSLIFIFGVKTNYVYQKVSGLLYLFVNSAANVHSFCLFAVCYLGKHLNNQSRFHIKENVFDAA